MAKSHDFFLSLENRRSHKLLVPAGTHVSKGGGALRLTLRPLVLLLGLALSGCATLPDISQSRSPCQLEPGGWCGFVRDAAVEAWPYAVASTNAYTGDDDLFAKPGRVLQRIEHLPIAPEDADKGFSYELFNQYAPGSGGDAARKPVARVLAFRGTDLKGLSDIFFGTLRGDQIALALRYFNAERARLGDDLPWVVTGHSLGGALATEVSDAHPEVRAFMFNTSPFYRNEVRANALRRTVFNERGEFLRRFARNDEPPAANVFTINCEPRKNAIVKHKVRPLADCITWIAAYASTDAQAVVSANGIAKPLVECGPDDKAHPGPGSKPNEPCVHNSLRKDKPKGKDKDQSETGAAAGQ
ncbi:alpha/beta hydrolase [Porphyrobacter sp. ULC335]|uniref:alpha/beta hydrolase n=1 Tax=Porphyrobacter sp. ULC335 TaxID=2854260 RepID=UPI00221F2040|nr:alpha/beta hydrolase [Porphyrobacter sp. ULC335]UYV15236.1 alpha/beta hydrolase [Porphyrobacter sp. ULC335]